MQGLGFISLIFILQLKFSADQSSFDAKGAICLLKIIYQSTLENVGEDDYLIKIKNIIDKKDTVEMSLLSNISIINSINQLMLDFNFLEDSLKSEIRKCELNTESTYLRCIQIYGDDNCFKVNDYAYSPTCPTGFELYNNFICYKPCPEDFEEYKNKCKKPDNYMLKMYSNKAACIKNRKKRKDENIDKKKNIDLKINSDEEEESLMSNNLDSEDGCIGRMNDTFFTEICKENYNLVFFVYCQSVCNEGFVESGNYCYKRYSEPLPPPVVFDFSDLFQ